MKAVIKICAGAIAAAAVLAVSQHAAASDQSRHDHSSYDASHDDYYERDRHYRRGDYRRDRYRDRHRSRYGRGYYRPRSEVVFRRHINTRRYDAYITIVEENYWTRSGRVQRVCSVLVRGPEAYYVPHRRLERAANRNCSRRARIQFL